jgi:tRNA A-37 threonylcarbamoyl transferase component Bud32
VRCFQLLRNLPGKRQVYRAQWGGQPVVAKVFSPCQKALKYWRREKRGIVTLMQKGILTPEILHSGSLVDNDGLVIILPFIAGAQTALERWQLASSDQTRRELIFLLVGVLAAHHQASLVQRDLHLGNFLVRGKQVFTLDGSDVVLSRKGLSLQQSLDNLGLLFAQFFPGYDRFAETGLRLYCRLREMVYDKNLLTNLQTRIEVQRRKRRQRQLRKIFRECSAVVCHQTGSQTILCRRNYFSETMVAFLADPDRYLEGKKVELLKDGNSSTVARVKIDALDLVVKRYNIKNVYHGLKRAVARTRASKSWENAHRLNFYGIETASPVAMVENLRGTAPRISYFISEYVEGVPCEDFFKSNRFPREERERAAKQVAALLARLHGLQIRHGDLKASNIIIADRGPVLVDLDAMREYASAGSFHQAGVRDVQRFMRNWEGDRELSHFFQQQLKQKGILS